jgi:protein tyrosine/serine phosphatase
MLCQTAGSSAAPDVPAATLPATSAAATTISPSTSPALKPQRLRGVDNFAKVSAFLYRGAQPTAEGFAQIRKLGVRTVVNLRSVHSDRDELKGLGLRYVHIACQAWHPEDEDVVRFLKVLSDPANHPVFVHCQEGADRTGCMVAAWRMFHDAWGLEAAVEELRTFGFHPIWSDITAYLRKFNAEAMRQKLAATPAPKIDTVE